MSPNRSLLVTLLLGAACLHCQRPSVAVPAQTMGLPNPGTAVMPAKPPAPHLLPAAKEGDLPCDSKDHQAVIVGPTNRAAILAHRPIYQTNADKTLISPDLTKRWKDLATPCTLVVAFGSWCGDSQRELPEFLALMAEENPFVKVHFLGVYRDKKVTPGTWPQDLEPQTVAKVPTFWLYALQPGGGNKLVGSIVENPPKKGQGMAEAIVELLETIR